ncbi:MAG TPA: tetratricopeptide repeat protein [Bryobacteraceae bacterium]|nr:tetratricopeptide repeat protein [Bryobacteraceae bacterium]
MLLKTWPTLRAGLVLVGFVLSITSLRAQQDPESDRQAYAAKIRETYNFHFGKDKISTPGNAAVEGNDFIPASAFPTAEYCGRCHAEAYSQWRQALHSNSFRTPFYRTSVNILLRTKGIEFTRHCDSCHNPVAVLAGGLTQISQVDRSFDEDGLTCATCHSIQKLQSTNGNGGFVFGIPSVLVDEDGKRIPGIVPDEEIRQHPDRHSRAVMQSFYRTPEFCASCHKANLPNPLNDYKFIRAFTVYDEWQNSKFSNRNPLTFYTTGFTTCQDCHMQRSPITLKDDGAKHGTLVSHRWPAGNTAVPFYYGFDQQLQKTVEFLKSGNYLNVDLFAIKRNGEEGMIAPLGSTAFKLAPDDTVQMMVVIQNKNIGHSLVPEVRDLYEPWVEFQVTDAGGAEIYHSGFLKPDGSLEPGAHSFTNRPVNTDGVFVDNHKVWTIQSVAYDNTIQSGRSALVRYQFHIPADAKGPLTVTARVNYRHLRQSYLNNIFGADHPAYPVVELSSRTRILNLGDNPAASDSKDNQDWMRWNNLGIGFLDQLQYADAMQAFEQVPKLRPDYADGFINIALTYIEWEKYSSARPSLEKALEVSPNNARALYYLALVERREGHFDEELADLQRVVEQYPQARDPRRELGIAYYQRHSYDEARQQFEALQAIDPDDLAAHYNLAVLYRRMGMKEKAAEQAAMFATKQVDPGAPTYSMEFLRVHPEISNESVPWHLHSDSPHPVTAAGGGGQGK